MERQSTTYTILVLFLLPFGTCLLEVFNAQGKTGESAAYAGAGSVMLAFLLYPIVAIMCAANIAASRKSSPAPPKDEDACDKDSKMT